MSPQPESQPIEDQPDQDARDARPDERDAPGDTGADEPREPARADDAARDAPPPTDAPADDDAQRAKEFEDRWLRAKAELENSRRRQRQELDEARRYGAVPLLNALLGVLDTLQRAIDEAAKRADDEDALLQGLRLTEQQFLMALQEHGVTPLETRPGDPLDPDLHRALLEQPSREQPPGTILSVFQTGYRLHERLLREAQVVVAREPDDASATESDDAHV